jgi:hypothetical protein
MRPTAELRMVSLATAGLLALSGCFFEPREPEQGGGPVCFEKITQENELNVFANLDGSFQCRQSQTYLEQFSEEFVFVPAPSVAAQNPDVFPDPNSSWGIEQETEFVDGLFTAATDTIISQVYDQVRPPQGSTEILFEGDYSITVVEADGSQIEYTGTALYTLRQERAIWVMVRWEEQESSNPLGQLRASLVR